MREVEKRMVAALRENISLHEKDFKTIRCGNNTVVAGLNVYLHGNCIAKFEEKHDGYRLVINMCGWPSVTTRSRINAVLSGMGLQSRVFQKNNRQHIWTPYGEEKLSPFLNEQIEY